jgi:hypothetical protein
MPVVEHNALNRLFRQDDCYSKTKSFWKMHFDHPDGMYSFSDVSLANDAIQLCTYSSANESVMGFRSSGCKDLHP